MATIFKGSLVLLNHYLFKLKSASFEKKIPYMYLDSQGYLTVGIGHNIDARGDLLELPFGPAVVYARCDIDPADGSVKTGLYPTHWIEGLPEEWERPSRLRRSLYLGCPRGGCQAVYYFPAGRAGQRARKASP
jgi:hypothetical protein